VSGPPAPPSTDTPATLGHPRVHLRRTGSTNELARELASGGAPHGTLVTASEQTAGRGRQGRRWSAPAGSSLLMSLLLRWPISDRSSPLLSLVAGVAVCEAVGGGARIKWPNDVVIENAGGGLGKLAGILVEGRPQEGWAVLGIGVNVAVDLARMPAELRGRAATLGRHPAAIEPLLELVLGALRRWLSASPDAALEAWRARDALRGRAIAWGAPAGEAGRGVAIGIDAAGHLIVELADGRRETLQAGEVHLGRIDDAILDGQ
jgi:BirA family transcriptional regulator, biotin operon repressor / biotin---[acetyl-CoA-carboxylase] ligase